MKLFKILAASLISVFAVVGLSACSTSEPVDPSKFAQIIDVRTEQEWSEGHLDGAVRIGIADPDFTAVMMTLDPAADYYVYCRSGNRSGQAIEAMRTLGFTGDLVNGGPVANASAELGIAVIK